MGWNSQRRRRFDSDTAAESGWKTSPTRGPHVAATRVKEAQRGAQAGGRPKTAGWAEAEKRFGPGGGEEKGSPRRLFFSFLFSKFKSKFKFKSSSNKIHQKSNKNPIFLIQHECKIINYIICQIYILSYKIGFYSFKLFKLILNFSKF